MDLSILSPVTDHPIYRVSIDVIFYLHVSGNRISNKFQNYHLVTSHSDFASFCFFPSKMKKLKEKTFCFLPLDVESSPQVEVGWTLAFATFLQWHSWSKTNPSVKKENPVNNCLILASSNVQTKNFMAVDVSGGGYEEKFKTDKVM